MTENLTIGIRVDLLQNFSYKHRKSDSTPKKANDLVWLYFYSLINLNLAKMRKELSLKNRINIVLDFQNAEFDSKIIQYLVEMNNNSFPCYLKYLYLMNLNIHKLIEDTKNRDLLKSKGYKDIVLVLPDDYYEPLYRQIQPSTALEEYYGELETEIF